MRLPAAVAHVVLGALTAIRDTIDDNVEALGDIDAVAGDGDHGIGMQRGARAAVEAAAAEVGRGGGAGAVLTAGADAWADRAGGTSGALWGLGLRVLGTAIGDQTKPDAQQSATASPQHYAASSRWARPTSATKPSWTCWHRPATRCPPRWLRQGLGAAFAVAADVADKAAQATADLLPKLGRARPLAEKSLGTPDAGAVSMALAFGAVSRALADRC